MPNAWQETFAGNVVCMTGGVVLAGLGACMTAKQLWKMPCVPVVSV